jgi:hypothetical protein
MYREPERFLQTAMKSSRSTISLSLALLFAAGATRMCAQEPGGKPRVACFSIQVRRVAQVPGGKSEFSHKRWVPRVPRLWAPGIAIRCRLRGHHTYSPS